MTEKIVNSVLFYFFCGTLDVLATIIVLFTGIGVELNPVWNWIQPTEMLAVAIVSANLIICTVIILGYDYIPHRLSKTRKIIPFALFFEGVARLCIGFLPGMLLIIKSGLVPW